MEKKTQLEGWISVQQIPTVAAGELAGPAVVPAVVPAAVAAAPRTAGVGGAASVTAAVVDATAQ